MATETPKFELVPVKKADIPDIERNRVSIGQDIVVAFLASKKEASEINLEKDASVRSVVWSINRYAKQNKHDVFARTVSATDDEGERVVQVYIVKGKKKAPAEEAPAKV